jgi:hypothetical protein
MKKDVSEKLPADLNGLQMTLKRLQACLERAHAYVDDVVVCTHVPVLAHIFIGCISISMHWKSRNT